LLVDVIRRTTGDVGLVGGIGRAFSWQNNQPASVPRRNLHISVLPRGGKTTIRVSQNLSNAVGGLFGGIMGGVGGGTSGLWIGIATRFPVLGVGLWLGTIAATYATARGIFGVISRRRERVLRGLAESIAEQVRESIAAARSKLPKTDARRLRG
jgi:hypothetical protein